MTSRSSADTTILRGRKAGWLREPLLHFVLLGALLFGIDHVLVGRTDDPNTIVLGTQADQEIRQVFSTARGRDPNAEELAALRARWLDNEVLYREGLALQVDRGDSAIRERVIFKALSVVDANVKLPPIEDERLRQWFETQRARYDLPARYDFQEAVLAGTRDEAAVARFVAELNAGTPADTQAGLRVFNARPHPSIVQTYGEAFAQALEASPVGEWRAHATRDGWRAMRLVSVTPAQSADFDTLRGVVLQDWTDATMAEQRTAAVRALARKYALVIEDAPQ
jgi:hypothetical protein